MDTNGIKEKITGNKNFKFIAAAVIAVILLIIIIVSASGSYKTPIKKYEKVMNGKATTIEKMVSYESNGFTASELKAIVNANKKIDKDEYKDKNESLKERKDDLKDQYGNNFKIKIKIDDKEKLDKDDLKDIQNELREAGKSGFNELSNTTAEDLADELDTSKSKAKTLLKATKKYFKKLKTCKVTAGYTVSCTVITSGKELDEPIEKSVDYTVIKVNGKWILEDAYGALLFTVVA